MIPGQGHFRGGHEIKVFLVVFVEVIGKLGQLPGPKDCFGLDHKGCVLFSVALLDMQIEHEGDQRSLEACPGTVEHVEARAGDFDAALEIDDTQSGAKFPMGLGFEIEFRDFARGFQNYIFALVDTVGRFIAGQVGYPRHHGGKFRLHLP